MPLLVQAYANSYTGNAKINRLVFISEKTADAGIALSALKIAAEELKKVRILMIRPAMQSGRKSNSQPCQRVIPRVRLGTGAPAAQL